MATVRAGTILAALFGLFTLTAGCSKQVGDVKRVPVSGKVTFESKLLATGNITFDAQNGQPPAVLSITDGKYDGQCPVGKCKVVIKSMRKVALKDKAMAKGPGYDQEMEEESLPARYNAKSEIVKEVTEAGPNTFDFDLQPK